MNPLSNAFGLDIGDRTFKLIQMARKRGKKGGYRITAWSSVDVPEGIMERGEIKDMAKATGHLRTLLAVAHGKVSGRATVACLPEAKTFIKIIEVHGEATAEAMHKAVISEIEQNIPLPVDDIYFDWQRLDGPPTAGGAPSPAVAPTGAGAPAVAATAAPAAPKTLVLLGAAPKRLVDDYTALLEHAGLAPLALEIEAMAISRAIIPDEPVQQDAIGILDIGATRSSLVICDEGVLRMSISIPISGIAITKLVSTSLGVSMVDAEKLKRECGLDADRCDDKMWKILLPLIDDMTEKIRNALRFYQIGFPDGKKIERVYLCGGGAQFREIDAVLSRKLAVKARRGDALVNVDSRLPKGFSIEESPRYATAIGLGIRAAEEYAKFHGPLA
jgi:type IV pilus assembly protein PilM